MASRVGLVIVNTIQGDVTMSVHVLVFVWLRLRSVAVHRGSLGPENRATQRYTAEGRKATNFRTLREKKKKRLCLRGPTNVWSF